MSFDLVSVDALYLLRQRIAGANARYGKFTSTHEALGVCAEEWAELCGEVRANSFAGIQREALDLAAALIRLHDQLEEPNSELRKRSRK